MCNVQDFFKTLLLFRLFRLNMTLTTMLTAAQSISIGLRRAFTLLCFFTYLARLLVVVVRALVAMPPCPTLTKTKTRGQAADSCPRVSCQR